MEIKHIQNENIMLETRVSGPEDGEVIILLHGFPECWNTWRHQIPQLADAGYRVYAPNLRGYGQSSKPDKVMDYHLECLITDVDAIRKESGRNKVHIVAHDWGGAIGWTYANKYSEHTASLSVLNMPHLQVFLNSVWGSLRQMLKSWYIVFFQLPWLPERFLSFNNFAFFKWIMKKSSAEGSYTDRDIEILEEHWKTPGALTASINYYRAIFRKQPRETRKESRVTSPTQILWGEQDIALSTSMAEKSLEYTEGGSLTTYPDGTHWLAHDKPDEVTNRVLEHLAKHKVADQ